jgi:hypothetical protein
MIAGDDYHGGAAWGDDVLRAVAEYVASGAARMVSTFGNQFLLQK